MVEVEMPERPHVLGFVAANFSLFASLTSIIPTAFRSRPPLANKAVCLHLPPDGGIGSQRPERIISIDECREIVVVQLVAPVLVCAVLPQ